MSTATSASPTQREPELLGQTVVVIGGSGGIGFETARRARAEGAKVILTGRDPERLRRAARELEALSTTAFDATDPAPLERFFRDLPAKIDHVMVTAGRPHYGRLVDLDFAQARRALDEPGRVRGQGRSRASPPARAHAAPAGSRMKSSARIGCSSAGTPTPFDLSGTVVRTFGPQSKVRTDLGTWICAHAPFHPPAHPGAPTAGGRSMWRMTRTGGALASVYVVSLGDRLLVRSTPSAISPTA